MNQVMDFETEFTFKTQRKQHVNERISEINGMFLLPQTQQKFGELKVERMKLISEGIQLDRDLTKMREQRKEKLKEEQSTKPAVLPKADRLSEKLHALVTAMVALRSDYEAFAADATRVNSMRRMASGFVVDLNKIIRETLRKDI